MGGKAVGRLTGNTCVVHLCYMKDRHLTLRLPEELARALARWARARGQPRSEVVREAVTRYLAPPASGPGGRIVAARELALRWPGLPRLEGGEAAEFGEDIDRSRAGLPAAPSPWE